jgi:hypothetical protein
MGGALPCLQNVQGNMLFCLKIESSESEPESYFCSSFFFYQFVEDDGDIVFYKDAYGQAAARSVFSDADADDSGIEVDDNQDKDL